ncbi:FAD-binding domain-containing protein [Oceaniglobus indicus]|uniref:FAD-binding domain-containing protein n=1 Tax=Oceaniglobus indicus TaxID=2047749 RepID=UPI000C19C42F|nr:FAD-binding domain-containing protein [Oceaniglobus indicus]
MNDFTPTRAAGLDRMARFLPRAAAHYGARRNYDADPPATSALSPWLRHRLVTEPELLAQVFDTHGRDAADRFVTEVIWRTYWKGWLEMRPSVWADYRRNLNAALHRVQTQDGLRARFHAACRGQTGIACFDHWAHQLATTGWLHNHARMWFASIWIFTLRLPWELGADLFLRQLLDGDPASNTLGWRWVAGIQSRGKHYVATADNIRRFTEGRFDPRGDLVEDPAPLDAPEPPAPGPLPVSAPIETGTRIGLLITTDDLGPMPSMPGDPVAVFMLDCTAARSPLQVSAPVAAFGAGAAQDAAMRAPQGVPLSHGQDPGDITRWIDANRLDLVVHHHAPVGPAADTLAAVRPVRRVGFAPQVRAYDAALWPHARRGFFRFRKDIPDLAPLVRPAR